MRNSIRFKTKIRAIDNRLKFSKATFAIVAIMMLSIAISGCKKDENDPSIRVTGVSLNKSSLSLNAGATETLIATITPTEATNKSVTWSSSDTSIASVDNEGKVVAVKAGSAIVTVTTVDGNKKADCTVTVTASTAKSVTIGTQNGILTAGMAGTASFSLTPRNMAYQTVESIAWYSNSAGTTTTSGTAGITIASVYTYSVSGIADVSLRASTTTAAPAGIYYFSITMGGVRSSVATLTISK